MNAGFLENAQRPTSNVQRPTRSVPVALTIAGSDSSAGAGIQADLKTFSALGVYGVSAVTCLVAEMPGKVSRIEPAGLEIVLEQIRVLLSGFPIAAVKTGLLCSGEIVRAVAELLRDTRLPIVVDPVMIATSGDQLLDATGPAAYENHLFPVASLITPNLNEASQFLGEKITDMAGMRRAVTAFAKKYGRPVLLKGGHLDHDLAIDLLLVDGKITEFSSPFIRDVHTHGTGCTYSAAITAGLASGLQLDQAIARAKEFVTAAIANHFRWNSEVDALNHFNL